jgi:SAM-dependent methyltransferase
MGSANLQADLWGPGARWWADLQEKQVLPLYRDTLGALAPLAGKKLLDAGCGAGLALSIAQRMGAIASGFDATPELATIATERAPNADIRVGDLEAAPFDDTSFDVVTAFNALQYAQNPMNALSQFKRVVKSGGFIAIGQWGEVGRCATEALFAKLRALAPPPPGTPAPLALSGDGVLERRLVDAELQPFSWGEVECPFEYPDLQTAVRSQLAAGPIVRVIRAVGEQKVQDVLAAHFGAAVQSDGSVKEMNIFRWVISKAP